MDLTTRRLFLGQELRTASHAACRSWAWPRGLVLAWFWAWPRGLVLAWFWAWPRGPVLLGSDLVLVLFSSTTDGLCTVCG